jgi:flagellar FliL protein
MLMSDANAVAQAPNKVGLMLMMIFVSLAAVIAGGAGAYFVFGQANRAGQADASAAPQLKLPAQYVKLDPPFVVNFEAKGLMRFLQVTVEIMTRDPETVNIINKNDPMIRNDLIMLFASQRYEDISTREGKERLRAEALKVVADDVTAEGGNGAKVEQLYFTSFVMQ